MSRRLFLVFLLLAIIPLSCKRGHAPFTHEFKDELKPAMHKQFDVDGPPQDQQLTVVVVASGAPVGAYIVFPEQVEALTAAFARAGEPDVSRTLANAVVEDKATLTATIPAGKPFALVLYNRGTK